MANPRFVVSAAGVNGNFTVVGGVKNGVKVGNPVQPLALQVPLNLGAGEVPGMPPHVAVVEPRQNCCDPSIRAVAIPGDPFWSLSTASACPIRSYEMPAPRRIEDFPGPP